MKNKKNFLLCFFILFSFSACNGNVLLRHTSQGRAVSLHISYLVDVQTYTPTPTLISSPFPTPTQDFAPTLSPTPTSAPSATPSPTFTTNTPMPTATPTITSTNTPFLPTQIVANCAEESSIIFPAGVRFRSSPEIADNVIEGIEAIPFQATVFICALNVTVSDGWSWSEIKYNGVRGYVVTGSLSFG